ncbi:MAG: DUF5993 family protein [Pseudomonadota bacterium]
MSALIFLVFTVAIILAWMDHARVSYVAFAVAIALGLFWFRHHSTDVLNIQL